MDAKAWLWQHWIPAAGAVGLLILERILDHFLNLGLLGKLWGVLITAYNTSFTWLTSSVSLPVWLVLTVSAYALWSLVQRLRVQYQEMAERRNVTTTALEPLLNTEQLRILHAISAKIEERNFPSFKELKEDTGFSHLKTEGAIDVLLAKGLMQWHEDSFGVYQAYLTPAGRAYLLSPEISSEYWNN